MRAALDPGGLDPRLAPLLSDGLEDIGHDARSVAAMLDMVARAPGLAALAEGVRLDPSLRGQAVSLLPRLVADGVDALGNANDVAVAALVDALCRAGEAPERLEARLADGHGLWWAPLVLSTHAA